MPKEKDQFLKLTPLEQIENLTSSTPELVKLISKDTKDLTTAEARSLYDLKILDGQATDVGIKLVTNLDNIKREGFEDFAEKLSEESQEVQEGAKKIYHNTITASINSASDDLNKGIKEKKGLLFNGTLASSAAKVLGGILEFEKQIDEIFPGVSQKIIKAAGNALVGLVSSYFPVVGLVLKATGIVDKISNFLACDNLEKTVASLQERVSEIKQNKELEPIYNTAKEVNELSSAASIPIKSVVKLGLSAEAYSTVSIAVKQNENDKKFIQDIAQIAEKMPSNEKETQEMLGSLKTGLYNTIDKYNLPNDLVKSAQLKIDNKMLEVEKSLDKTTVPVAGVFAKIMHQQESLIKTLTLHKELQADFNKIPQGKTVADAIAKDMVGLLKGILLFSPDKLLKQAKESSVAKILGLDFKTEVSLDKQEKQLSPQNLSKS
ncbi:hypothetical protein Trichorick_00154 [Candidatus Trichorickettsia mobilis]|uniref:Uncharacterized protein n=1 Tax=Candidatus Trichorickettsia mobilis TaxID=1346319 RepID=A0ABZ0UT63_9RICK|nr:hypothetical protein [Candidatus Trichorickettsia mobilis]WPY00282.1 hypothetical protein Trichorick_00154 [Candidatus Trichorickettsia mobilis]